LLVSTPVGQDLTGRNILILPTYINTHGQPHYFLINEIGLL
jgi:hypothetical protein